RLRDPAPQMEKRRSHRAGSPASHAPGADRSIAEHRGYNERTARPLRPGRIDSKNKARSVAPSPARPRSRVVCAYQLRKTPARSIHRVSRELLHDLSERGVERPSVHPANLVIPTGAEGPALPSEWPTQAASGLSGDRAGAPCLVETWE